MASFANTSVRSFIGAQGGFGRGSYDAAKKAGLSDEQIRTQLSTSGLQVGDWVNTQLGIKPSSAAPTSTTQTPTGTVTQAAAPTVNSFRSGKSFNLESYNAAIKAGLNDDQIRNQLLGSDLRFGLGVQSKLGLPNSPIPLQQLPPAQPSAQSQLSGGAAAGANQPAAASAPASGGAPGGGTRFAGDAFQGNVASSYLQGGINVINEVVNNNKDNATIGGIALGKLGDVGSTMVNTGLAIGYNRAMMAELGGYQQNLENTKTANAMQLMATEGGIAKQLQRGNNATLRYNADAEASAKRYTADKSLDEAREQAGAYRHQADRTVDVAREQAGATRFTAEQELAGVREQAGATRFTAEQQLAGVREQAGATRFTAEQQLAGVREQASAQRYGYDQELAGVREQTASAERQIALKGNEDRRTLGEQTLQQLALRRDARGAIASAGRRFYG